jgi:hypothetical protein
MKNLTKIPLIVVIVASNSIISMAAPSIDAQAEGDATVTAPVSVIWAEAYPQAAANLTVKNSDGLNNQQKMLSMLPPDNRSLNFSGKNPVVTAPVPRINILERQKSLHELAAQSRVGLAEKQNELERRAAQFGVPKYIDIGGGKVGTLVDVDDQGQPVYVAPNDIYAAATSKADQLWPTNSVTAVPGWVSGSSGLNLTGTNQLVDIWEADYTPGSAGVETDHDQFNNGVGGSRVVQGDSTGTSPHATAVAGIIASGGISENFNLSSLFGPSATNVDLGNYSRGHDFQGNIISWSLGGFVGNFYDEAGNGLEAANNSWGEVAGWVQSGTNWYWYGGNNTNQTDWQFGAYVGTYSGSLGGTAPRQLDNESYTAPNTLILFSSGNSLNVGPGHATNYYFPGSMVKQTATKNWLDGDAGGYRTITPSQCAKDVLTVGAVYAITPAYSNAASVILASFSSIGPTTDGRIKPEVVAAGTLSSSITSNNPYGFPGLVTPWWDSTIPTLTYDYAWVSGTSFSCPAVASGLGLILQERNIIQPTWQGNGFPVLSSTLRALAVHAADQAGTNAGPSYTFGYGLFDAQNAVNLLIADAVTATNPAAGFKPYIKEVDLPAGAYIQYNIYATNSSSPLKVTLAWTDPQGPAQATNVLNDPTPRLVNDLDVRIYPPGTTTFSPNASTTYKPWILNPDLTNLTVSARSAAATTGDDTRNNLEQVVVNSPLTGTNYIVRITYKGTLKDNAGHTANDQWASLIMSGNLSTALPFIITAFIPQTNGDFIITWNAVVGGEYIIQTSTDLITWTDESGDINANLENMSELITPSGPYTYYRIKRIY